MATSFDQLPEKPRGIDYSMSILLDQMIRIINQLKVVVNDLEAKVETLEGYH